MADKQLYDYQNNEEVALFVLVKGAEVRVAKNGKKFIAFTFQDTSGSITGKFWDASDADIELYQAGEIVFLSGKRELYQGKPQIKIHKLRLATPDENEHVADYLPKAPVSASTLREELNQAIFEITNANWNRVVRWIMARHQEEFLEYPAAKTNHHAFKGGLAYHTITMLHLAKVACDEYPEIKRPLLYAGVILHDIGKTVELTGPVATQYTVAGNLLGHIVIVDEEIVRACIALKIDAASEDMLLLRHVILAHHGLREYGSPVEPELIEAEVLHQLDNFDASMQMMTTTLRHTEPGGFSERIFGMNNRNFYQPKEE